MAPEAWWRLWIEALWRLRHGGASLSPFKYLSWFSDKGQQLQGYPRSWLSKKAQNNSFFIEFFNFKILYQGVFPSNLWTVTPLRPAGYALKDDKDELHSLFEDDSRENVGGPG